MSLPTRMNISLIVKIFILYIIAYYMPYSRIYPFLFHVCIGRILFRALIELDFPTLSSMSGKMSLPESYLRASLLLCNILSSPVDMSVIQI